MSARWSGLLALIAAAEQSGKGGAALPFYATPRAEIAAFAAEHALDLSFVHLVMTFATGDLTVWRRMITALPVGGDTRMVAVRWIGWLWEDPQIGFRRRIRDAGLRADGDLVCALHRRACGGDKVARGEWRQARTKLLSADKSDEVEKAAVEGIAAAAWDLDTCPGAVTDMIYPWKATLFAEIARDLDWDAQKQQATDERISRMIAAGRAHADAAVEAARKEGALSLDASANVVSTPLYQNAYNQGASDFLARSPSELDRYGERTRAAVADLYRLGREGLLQQIGLLSATPVAAAVA